MGGLPFGNLFNECARWWCVETMNLNQTITPELAHKADWSASLERAGVFVSHKELRHASDPRLVRTQSNNPTELAFGERLLAAKVVGWWGVRLALGNPSLRPVYVTYH
jgi:hypothetical protein